MVCQLMDVSSIWKWICMVHVAGHGTFLAGLTVSEPSGMETWETGNLTVDVTTSNCEFIVNTNAYQAVVSILSILHGKMNKVISSVSIECFISIFVVAYCTDKAGLFSNNIMHIWVVIDVLLMDVFGGTEWGATLQEANISHHWKSKIVFKSAFGWDMLIPRKVVNWDNSLAQVNGKSMPPSNLSV